MGRTHLEEDVPSLSDRLNLGLSTVSCTYDSARLAGLMADWKKLTLDGVDYTQAGTGEGVLNQKAK